MDKINVAVFDSKPYDIDFLDKINTQPPFNFNLHFFPNHLTSDTVQLSKGFNCVCAFVNDKIDEKVINVLYENGVKLIALRSAGYNNVDLKAAYKKIHVVRVPAYSPYAIAEHAVALMLSLNRKTYRAYFRTRDSNFSINGLLGFDMRGKTAGVIGTGKIGKAVIEILKGFGMNVLAHDVYPDTAFAQQHGVIYSDLKTLYNKSDIITLHCPLTPENMYMINNESIGLMKSGVMIINTGRGKLINTQDLINGLKSRKIGSAGLDVYEEEGDYFFEDFSAAPIGDDVLARLLTFPNVLITSHQAFFTREALEKIAEITLENIRQFFTQDHIQNEICYRCMESNCTRKDTGKCF